MKIRFATEEDALSLYDSNPKPIKSIREIDKLIIQKVIEKYETME